MNEESRSTDHSGVLGALERLRSRVERRVGIKEGVVTLPRVPRNTPPPPSPATRPNPPRSRPPEHQTPKPPQS